MGKHWDEGGGGGKREFLVLARIQKFVVSERMMSHMSLHKTAAAKIRAPLQSVVVRLPMQM